MVVRVAGLTAADDLDGLPRHPLAARVSVPAAKIHELPIRVADRRVHVEQHLALRRALAPRLVLRQRQKSVRDPESKSTRAEVDTYPDPVLFVGEHVDVVIARAHGAELLPSFGTPAA